MPIKTYRAGKEIIHENQLSRKMFIIKNGKVRIVKDYLDQKVTMAILGPGEVFGELSFIDAEPRSATVEAITNVEVVELSPDDGENSLDNLPPWVSAILKVLCHRFRELDSKVLALQSMNDFQKRTGQTTNKSKNIYLELKRFNKLLKMIHQNRAGELNFQGVYKEMDSLSGSKFINLREYLKNLIDQNFVQCDYSDSEDLFRLSLEDLEKFDEYLEEHVENNNFTILSHSAIQLLGQIINIKKVEDNKFYEVSKLDLANKLPWLQETLKELCESEIIKDTSIEENFDKILFNSGQVRRNFIYQNLIKLFDHDIEHYFKD